MGWKTGRWLRIAALHSDADAVISEVLKQGGKLVSLRQEPTPYLGIISEADHKSGFADGGYQKFIIVFNDQVVGERAVFSEGDYIALECRGAVSVDRHFVLYHSMLVLTPWNPALERQWQHVSRFVKKEFERVQLSDSRDVVWVGPEAKKWAGQANHHIFGVWKEKPSSFIVEDFPYATALDGYGNPIN